MNVFSSLGNGTRALHMLGEHTTAKLPPSPFVPAA